MALSDLTRFNEQTYSVATEVLSQQIELFNEKSRGAIQLNTAANMGDYSETAMFGLISGLVRRRNAYGTGSVSAVNMPQILERSVKVAAGTAPVNLDPSMFKWILMNPEIAGAAMGQQLAKGMMADMLNASISGGYAALSQITALVNDASSATINNAALVGGAAKLGDRYGDIVCWVMHSKVLHDLFAANVANAQQLFSYDTVNVLADPFGRVYVVSDSASLVTVDGVSTGINKYHSLGLVPGGIVVQQNNDFTDNTETKNGGENILRTYQAEWSFNVGVKGFAWDKTNGGASPTSAALATATNWDKYAADNKDLLGVLVESR